MKRQPRRIRLVIDSGRPYGRALLEGVLRRGEAAGKWRFQHSDRVSWQRLARELRADADCDGLLCDARTEAERAPLRRLRLPLVCLSGDADPQGLPTVAEDNRAVGRMAAEHLLALGFRELAFYPTGSAVSYRHREEGFRAAVDAAGGRLHVLADARQLRRRLPRLPRPLACFAVTDERALEVCAVCAAAGLGVPDEVAVLGVGDDHLACRLARPTLSSIDHGLVQIGWEGLELLEGLLAGRRRTGHRRVAPIELVARASTDTVAAPDPLVAAALRLMRDRAGERCTVPSISAALGISRAALDAACQRDLACSAAVALRRERVRQAGRLLGNSELTTAVIAQRVGLSSAAQLSVLFKRVTGSRPRDFRKRQRIA